MPSILQLPELSGLHDLLSSELPATDMPTAEILEDDETEHVAQQRETSEAENSLFQSMRRGEKSIWQCYRKLILLRSLYPKRYTQKP